MAQRDDRAAEFPWLSLGGRTRLRDLGPDRDGFGAIRTVLVESLPGEPDEQPGRHALVTSLLDTPVQALVPLAESRMSQSGFFGHPTWPLRDGKPPSSDPRGVAAYCRLATIATNVLVLLARHLGAGWELGSLRAALRRVPSGVRAGGPSAVYQILDALRPLVAGSSS
jgi:hypothetical protein